MALLCLQLLLCQWQLQQLHHVKMLVFISQLTSVPPATSQWHATCHDSARQNLLDYQLAIYKLIATFNGQTVVCPIEWHDLATRAVFTKNSNSH